MVNWEKVAKPARPARAALSYDAICAAGVEVADSQGLDALTMRKVADHLGAGAMSLYRYVDSRDDLLELLADHVSGEAIPPQRTGDWRADLIAAAHAVRDLTLRHPWLGRITLNTANLGPNALTRTESTLALLDGHGLQLDEMLDAWTTVLAFTQGHASAEASRLETAQRRSEQPAAEKPDAEAFPLTVRAFQTAAQPVDPAEIFDRRLGYLLDGLARTFFDRA